ncbi:MAG: DUF1963 domain-containing protein [Verrucomicrobiota bacterium]
MTNEDFIQELATLRKPANRVHLESGNQEQAPITKISGVPWWPKNCARPTCKHGHPMTFMAQILLKNVPAFPSDDRGILSFHYCEQCGYDGNMSFGFNDSVNQGYDVRVFEDLGNSSVDGLGALGESTLPNHSVSFSQFLEVPKIDDMTESLRSFLPEDYCGNSGDYEENDYNGLIHRPLLKLGGWPSWVQSAQWPTVGSEKMKFVCQFDAIIGTRSTWGGGGFAYLFISPDGVFPRRGELVIQTT